MPHRTRRQHLGLSLVEALVTTAVTSLALGATLPGFGDAIARRQLEGQAAQLATDLRLARSLAVAQGQPVRLRVQQHADGACYVLHTGGSGACSCTPQGATRCDAPGEVLRSASFRHDARVQLSANVGQMLFHGQHGTTTPGGTFRLTLADGTAVHHVVGIVGRVRSCSPGGRVSGLATCA